MRFLVGVIVGIVIGRPVLALVNEQFDSVIKDKLVDVADDFGQRLQDYSINHRTQKDKR